MKRLFALLVAASLLLSSCGSKTALPVPDDPSTPEMTASPLPDRSAILRDNAQNMKLEETHVSSVELLNEMTVKEKVGQLFLIRPDSLDPSLTPDQISDPELYGNTEATDSMLSLLKEYPAGGFVLFGKNLTDPVSLESYMLALSSSTAVPPLFAVDEEGGSVSRIANADGFDAENIGFMADIGTTGDPARAYAAGKYIGGYLSAYGFHLDFSPVADINSNPGNIVIGNRAFGSDPSLVSGMVASFLRGLHEEGIIGCIKHFPGHGDTGGDTHEDFVSIPYTWEQLQAEELIPFTENFANTDLVMVAHLTLPKITGDGLPASLSAELITGRMRNELGYTGLIATDALDMGAIVKNYSSAEAAVLAFEAGADILLMPYDYRDAFDGMCAAVLSGRISEERLDESVQKILNLKSRYGIL